MSIDRYLTLAMIRGGIPILGLLLGLFGFLTLAEELEDVGRGDFEVNDALNVMVLSLPKIGLDLLPVTSLVGVLVGLGMLANQQELIALRAAGWSNFRIARPVLSLALLIILGTAATQQWLVPLLEQRIAALRAEATLETELESQDADFWTRSQHQIVRIGGVQFGLMPTDVEIYQQDEAGHVTRLLQATRADILSGNTWQLWNVTTTEISATGTRTGRQEALLWQSVLSPDQMATIITTAAALPPTDLAQYVRHLEENGLDSHRYRLVLWQQLSLPIGILAMALLGVPFVVGSTRVIAAGTRISIGIVIGILFYLGERTLSQVALLYGLPPVPMAMGPDLVILVLAILALSRAR
ncbi:MAG: LPS export ABC transporter permease LptG [Pseudomonadales bacterium]